MHDGVQRRADRVQDRRHLAVGGLLEFVPQPGPGRGQRAVGDQAALAQVRRGLVHGFGRPAPGGRVGPGRPADLKLGEHLHIRGDYEYQKWTSFPNGGLTPRLVTIGAAYHFTGTLRQKFPSR